LEEAMKKILVALVFLASTWAWAEKAPNPADYTIAIHVQTSRVVQICGDVTLGSNVCSWDQHLSVLINGKKFELVGNSRGLVLLRAGDYKAKILKDETKKPYEYMRIYQFLFSDGTTRDYHVAEESD